MTSVYDIYEPWDITDSPDPENIRRIIHHMSRIRGAYGIGLVPGEALDAIEKLLKIAYPGAESTYQCRICGDTIEVPKRSGKLPDMCKKIDCQRAANRQRV